jgi:hypothetical protein
LLIAYLITQHRLPGGQPLLVALAVAFVLCAGIALTLVRKTGLRMLRFVTLIPVVLTLWRHIVLNWDLLRLTRRFQRVRWRRKLPAWKPILCRWPCITFGANWNTA